MVKIEIVLLIYQENVLKPIITFFSLYLIVISLNGELLSQCSDAGICILGKKHGEINRNLNSMISLSYVFGSSGTSDIDKNNITYNSVKFGGEFQVFRASRIGFSIPYSYNSGSLGTASGIGDFSLYWTFSFPVKHEQSVSLQVGAKISAGKVNTTDSLPQSYMPGLGTNDLLFSAGYWTKYFSVSAGYQKTFGRSANDVTRLKRGDDLMFRAAYFQSFSKLRVKAEILTILRLQESSIQDPFGLTESFINVDGSNEPQVNLIGEVTYSVSPDFELTGTAALPLLKRDYNLDGLRRSFTISAGAAYLFSLE
jgi:hypothetical protein